MQLSLFVNNISCSYEETPGESQFEQHCFQYKNRYLPSFWWAAFNFFTGIVSCTIATATGLRIPHGQVVSVSLTLEGTMMSYNKISNFLSSY